MNDKSMLAIGAGILLATVLGGTVASIAYTRSVLREKLSQAAQQLGMPASWLYGLAKTESNWNTDATNLAGPDGARGGAWGLFQITLRTAQSYGYSGTGAGLLVPETQIEWMKRIMVARRPGTLDELAAWWNAGRRALADAPASTQEYAKKLATNAAREA